MRETTKSVVVQLSGPLFIGLSGDIITFFS